MLYLLNKTDLASPEDISKITKLIQTLNPKAKLIETQYSKGDLQEILNTNIFDIQEAALSAGWLLSLKEDNKPHASEADEYGVSSFVYRARVPFHIGRWGRFMDLVSHFSHEWKDMTKDQRVAEQKQQLMDEWYGIILRAKGLILLDSWEG